MSHVNTFINQCHCNLYNGTDFALQGIEYLTQKRGLLEETIKARLLGICHEDFELPDSIRYYGQLEDDEEKRDFSKFILGRIIVPIHDEFGYVVAFATRSIRDDGTTWWNTPFPKSNHLFLLGKSKRKIFESNKVYLVEGYMDAIVLQQCGIENAVAVMGTNLSLRQIGLLSRYCSNVCFSFDVDKNSSGQKAQKKSIIEINRFKIFDELSIICGLPEGVDPDEFILKYGKNQFLSGEKILEEKEIRLMSKSLMEKQL